MTSQLKGQAKKQKVAKRPLRAGVPQARVERTRRKKAEEALWHATEEWRTLFDSIPDMISITDKDCKILRVNKSFADGFRVKPQDAVGKTCYELIHGAPEPPSDCPHKDVTGATKFASGVYFEPNLGAHLETSIAPLVNERGDVTGWVHVFRDVSHRKKTEKDQWLAELRKLVTEMVHEANNPLMIISGNAQLSLLDGMLREETKNDLKIIYEECLKVKNIFRRMHKFSRLSKGEREETDVNQCVESAIRLADPSFRSHNAQIKKDLKRGLPAIVADKKQIHEVLRSLLSHARDAMPEGGTVTLRTSLEQDFLKIDIEDSGTGMDPEILSKIFEPQSAAEEQGTNERGTGLGLPACQGIIRSHDGELKFESQPGKGVTATILLPVKRW